MAAHPPVAEIRKAHANLAAEPVPDESVLRDAFLNTLT
jgi:hypothetical protein